MFRTSAPAEAHRSNSRLEGSRKWIRRLTGASRTSESHTNEGSSERPNKLKARSSKRQHRGPQVTAQPATAEPIVFASAANLRSRPHIVLPTPAKGYLSTRTPHLNGGRPSSSHKQNGRRPGTPKRNSVGAPSVKSIRRTQDRRPGSSKSTRSTRTQSLQATRRDFDDAASVISSASDAPAYLSCLDDYLPGSIDAQPTAPIRKEPPHILYISPFVNTVTSRPVSPALPSATSWTLEKSLGDLWDWRDTQQDGPAHRISDALSDATFGGSEAVEDVDAADEKSADGVKIDVSEESDVGRQVRPMPSLNSIRPLNISKPTLSLPLNVPGRTERQGSSSSLASPSSTLVSSPIVDVAQQKQDVWTTVSALRTSWEEDSEDVLTLVRRPTGGDDPEDALLSFRRLNVRQKKLGNYI